MFVLFVSIALRSPSRSSRHLLESFSSPFKYAKWGSFGFSIQSSGSGLSPGPRGRLQDRLRLTLCCRDGAALTAARLFGPRPRERLRSRGAGERGRLRLWPRSVRGRLALRALGGAGMRGCSEFLPRPTRPPTASGPLPAAARASS